MFDRNTSTDDTRLQNDTRGSAALIGALLGIALGVGLQVGAGALGGYLAWLLT
ncbi:MAG: hypothetical protein ABEI96_10510 [Haloarculaceae archaeon]